MGVALISMVFAGCKKEPTYTVQVTATEGGTVEGQNGEYKEGETVVFTAIPADGYYFTNWSDGNTDNPRSIVTKRDISLTAKFIGVSATATEGGTVETQKDGNTFVFTAKPSDGYYFTQWSDGSTDNPRTITISASDITLEAQFVQIALITITAGSNGTIGGSNNERHAQGDTLIFTAIPAMGYCFSQWSDGKIDNPRTIIVGTNDITLTAEFVEQPAIVTVDLGLTSGNLWATCNVGAVNPWNYGGYYAWGETLTKAYYSLGTYKYYNVDNDELTKYNEEADYGEERTFLEPTDDVATAVFGNDYSMPTTADWDELESECYWVWTTDYNSRGVSGYVVYRTKTDADKGVIITETGTPSESYSLSDTHIFLPASGGIDGDMGSFVSMGAGYNGYYWTSVRSTNSRFGASLCYFNGISVNLHVYASRYVGRSVRPVKRP